MRVSVTTKPYCHRTSLHLTCTPVLILVLILLCFPLRWGRDAGVGVVPVLALISQSSPAPASATSASPGPGSASLNIALEQTIALIDKMSETRSQIAEILGETNKERMTRLNEAVSSQKSDQERQAIVNTLEKDLKEDMSLADGMAASVLAHLAEWRDMMEEVEQFMSSASSSTTTLSNQASADNIIKIMLAHTKELCEQRITDKENTADEIMRVKTEAELLDSVNAYFKKQTRDAEESALQDTAMKKQHLQIILQNDKDASVSQGTV